MPRRALREETGLANRRGRPTGSEIDDTPLLRWITLERMRHPEKTRKSLLEAAAKQAEGASDEAIVQRLKLKERKRRPELEAWAREHLGD